MHLTRRQEAAILSVLLGGVILTGFVGRPIHAGVGVLFTLLAAAHLYDRRRCL